MQQRVYDFIPQSDGWAVVVDGRLVASYASLYLAVTAVKAGTHGKITDRSRLVMRRQGVDGSLHDLPGPHDTSAARDTRLLH
ncbi:hypothetical protein [Hoeflea olei]|uniref:DUF2188 domain-containing protein n=1 Tax=Hoeflea olei TaxID=1480615 RepID=A0A1C1YTV5_9HYPH|nr:hypothetical protein [Hoeflea olei]OCW56968.1 hypothetical protein AWJ14_07380 [Hoeflea olei]